MNNDQTLAKTRLRRSLITKLFCPSVSVCLTAALCLMVALPSFAQDDATEIKFTVVNTCFGPNNFGLSVDGTQVGQLNSGSDCTCSPPLRVFTTTDPTALNAVGEPGCTSPSLTQTGQNYIAWIRADITRAQSGTETTCIFDHNGGNCDVNNLCSAGYTSFSGNTFAGGLADNDGDGDPDCTDTDDDDDGVLDEADNCPLDSNPLQTDTDGNGLGDACDAFDRDSDGVWNINDNCPDLSNPDQVDTNNDGVGNACDENDDDADNDGIVDATDNCPAYANPDQADSDGNGTGDICQPRVAAVPFLGNTNTPHPVYSGGMLTLQAAATLPATGEAVALDSGTWDPGDGSGEQGINVSNSRALELTHVYTGATGQPFTAVISVVDSGGNTHTDTFKVRIQDNTLDTRSDMARDLGLWNLYKRAQLGTSSNGVPTAKWAVYGGGNTRYEESATAAAVQAMEINGHLESGDPLENPYVSVVAGGLAFLFDELEADTLSLQGGNDPEEGSDGDGIGLRSRSASNHWNYISGQVIDAIVASGTPNATATTGIGSVLGQSYRDIVQDMIDQYAWGATDSGPVGGWDYRSFNNSGGGSSNDSSASHWWAIGTMAGETWGLDSPQWLKDQNFTSAIPHWQPTPNGSGTDTCPCGYRSQGTLWDGGWNTTAACLIMINADDIPKTHPRFTCAERWITSNFYGGQSGYNGNWYDMFQTKKAMLTALNDALEYEPIDLLGGSIDWYDEFSQQIVDNQLADGSWSWYAGTAGSQVQGDLRNAWAIIILTPSLFEQGPIAACTADPSVTGLNQDVDFDASGSSHQNPNSSIDSYEWDLDGDGVFDDATGVNASSAYSSVGVVAVSVRVTGSGGLTDTASCSVEITDLDTPPNANITFTGTVDATTFCAGDTITLDGSTSSDLESAIAFYEWDVTSPLTFSPADGNGVDFDASTLLSTAGTYDVGLLVTDSDTIPKENSEFAVIKVLEATDARCNQPPSADAGGPYTVAEGSSVNLSGSASSDPDADTLTFAWDLDNNGTFETAGETPVFDASSLDDSVLTISLRVTDPSGASDDSSTTVTVLNVDPTVAAGADATINEGASFISGGSFTDPGTLDTWTATVDYGEGAGSQALALAGNNFSLSNLYEDDGVYTVTVTVTDDDGGVGSDTVQVTVENVAPTVAANAPSVTVNESITAVNAGTFGDVGDDTVAITASAGTVNQTGTQSGTWDWSFASTDGPNESQTVTITATDSDGADTTTTFGLTVNNVNPVVDAGADDTINEGATFVSGGSFTDPGADTWTATVDYGEGAGSQALTLAGNNFSLSNLYEDDGVYTVTVTVTDDDGGVGSDTVQVTVENVAPTVAANAPSVTVNESITAVNAGTFGDVGDDTVAITASAGTVNQTGSQNGTWDWSFASTDGPIESQTVTITATDSDGADTTTTFGLTVNNVNPVVDAGADDTINEGATFVSGGSFADPGADTWTATVDYGEGAGSQALALAGNNFSLSNLYEDDGVYTVTVTVTDDDGGVGSDTVQVTVENVAPTVAANAPSVTVNESITAVNAGTFGDVGDDTVAITASAGTVNQTGSQNGTWDWSFASTDGPIESQTVTITATDSDGADTTTTFGLTVNNVNPVVDAGADDTINEGATFVSGGSFADPGADTWTATVDYGEGAGSQALALAGNNFSLSNLYEDDGVYTVTVTVTDDDGGVGSDTVQVTVENVAPTVAANAPSVTVNESITAVNAGTFGDVGDDTVAITASAGTVNQTGSQNGTWDWSFASTDGPIESQTVTITATDSDGADTTTTFGLTVNNVAPTVDAGADATINEGASFISGGSFTDPGADTWTATVDYGEGAGSQALTLTGNNFSLSNLYEDDGVYTVTVTVTDDDGGVGSDTVQVTVENVAPTVAANAPSVTVNESITAVNAGTFGDVGDDTVAITASAGTVNQTGTQSGTWDWSFASTDGPNESQTVTITATDSDGADTTTTFGLTVNNVNPVVDAGADDTINEGATFVSGGSFTDPGADTWTATVDYGEGAGSQALTLTGNNFSLSNLYEDDGVYTVTVTVTDDDGGLGSDTVQVTVENVAPTVAANAPSVTVNESVTAVNAGTFGDVGDDTVAITASAGTVNQTGSQNGTWDWSFASTDGPNESQTITITATDSDGASSTTTFDLIVLNVPPVALDDDAYSTLEDIDLNVALPGVLINDSDVGDDTLSATVDTGPSNGSLVLNTDGSFVYTPNPNFNGTDSFLYTVTDDDGATDTGEATITVNAVNDGPGVSATDDTAQYSDPVLVTISGSDIDSTSLSIVTTALPDGLSLSAASCSVNADAPPGGLDCTWTVSGNIMEGPGTYPVTVTVTDNGELTDTTALSADTTFVITVEHEDARSTYTGPLFLTSDENDDFTVTLMATIRDITVVGGDPATDPDAGVITNATVRFEDETGAILCSATAVTLVFAGDEQVGSASCDYSGSLANNQDELPLEVTIVVNNYYVDTSDNEVVILIVKPGDGKITGGGQIVMDNSAGVYPAGAGLRTNYGFNAIAITKRNGRVTLKGRMTVIVRAADGHKYKIKSNALQSLGVDLDPDGDGNSEDEPFYAEFESKANLTDVTDPLNPVSLGGNLLLQMRMHDNGEPGENDTISLTLWGDGGTLLFSSNWDGAQSVEQLVERGNLQVHP